MSRVMLLWSGGVESTSLLKHLLLTTRHEVVAHHIQMMNPEQRDDLELERVERLVKLLRDPARGLRPFEFTHTLLRLCRGDALPHDADVVFPLGILAMRHHHCTVLLRGWCLEDYVDRPGGSVPDGTRYRRQAAPYLGLLRPNEMIPEHPTHAWPKARHARFLGDLAEETWSCRRPDRSKGYAAPCGKCHACREREAALRGTSDQAWIEERLSRGMV